MEIRHCIVRIGEGSGVLIQGKNDTHYILTCTHVLKGDWQNIALAFCDEEGAFSIELHTTPVVDPVSEDAEDIALLHCPEGIPTHYQAIKLLNAQHGRELPAYTYGFPAAFAENGRDDRCRVDKHPVKNNQGIEWLKLSESTGMKGGFSGSPLLDARYQHCLGIVSDLEQPDDQHGGTLVYAVPSETIAALFPDHLEVQHLSPYLARLRAMYQEVVLNDAKGMTLADIYVEPYYGVHRYCFKEKDKRITKNEQKPFINFDTNLHVDLPRLLTQEDCLELDGKKPGLVLLLGYPGQGKTSFCKRLIYDLTGTSPLPFEHIYFVRLRNVPNPADLSNNALKVIQTEIEDEVEAPPINWHNTLLILDGLDELNIKDGFHGGKIDDICKSLEQACERYPGLRIVLSSRYGYVDLDALKKRNIIIVRLEEFSKAQQLRWLFKYRAERFHPESPLTAKKLEEYHKHESVKELLGQAILLHMIASLEEDASDKPNRAAIYDSLFTQLVNRTWSNQGQISLLKDIGLDKRMLRYALQDIAHAIFMSGKGYLRREDLKELPKVKAIQDKLDQNRKGVDLWRAVMIAAYFDEKKKLREDQDEKDQAAYGIEFLHKSLYEYLCAEKMWRDIRNGFLSTNPDGDWSISEGKAALELASQVFSLQPMSQEVHDYLVGIIENHPNEVDKKHLADRMKLFLPYCLERHFLYGFDSSVEKGAFSKAIITFRGYWAMLNNLGQAANFLENENNAKHFASLCSTQAFEDSFIYGFNISYQILTNTNFRGANLNAVNLSMADLSSAELSGSNLIEAKLISTTLKGARLSRANLARAVLINADLSEAVLHHTILRIADLSKAKLGGARLRNADLAKAILFGANFDFADLANTNLEEAILSGCILSSTNLRGVNIDVESFQEVESLFDILGVSDDIIEKLKIIKPKLFEMPENF